MTAGTINTLPFCGACGHDLRIDNGVDVFCDACGQDANYTVTTPSAPVAENAYEGTPGTWAPIGSSAPADAAAAASIVPYNLFPGFTQSHWTAGTYVVCANDDQIYWDGTAWQTGQTPTLAVPDAPVLTSVEQADSASLLNFSADWTSPSDPAFGRWRFYEKVDGSAGTGEYVDDPSARTAIAGQTKAETPGRWLRVYITGYNGQDVPGPNSAYLGYVTYEDGAPVATGAAPKLDSPTVPGEGYYLPVGANPPADLAGMTGLTATPAGAWGAEAYVSLLDKTSARWDGAAWVAGIALPL